MLYVTYLQSISRIGSKFRLLKGSVLNKSSFKINQSVRKYSTEASKNQMKTNGNKKNMQFSKADLRRLFSLAKPERNRLLSMCRMPTIVINL